MLYILPLESVDEATGLARTRIPASYPMIKVRWSLRDVNTKRTVWVENVRAVLDEPGEWPLHSSSRTVTLFSCDGQRPTGIEAPQLTELLRVEGTIVDSVFEHLGGAGIVLAGYGPGRKDVNRKNEILRNHIHQTSACAGNPPRRWRAAPTLLEFARRLDARFRHGITAARIGHQGRG